MSNPRPEFNNITDINSMILPSIAIGLNEHQMALVKKGLDIFPDDQDNGVEKLTATDTPISLEKLSRFIKPNVVMRHRFADHEKYFKSPFKQCTLNDYLKIDPDAKVDKK